MTMVRFITGRAGQGKTRQIYSEIAEALNRSERSALLLIVPEQHTLQAEKELVNYLGGAGILDVEVTSFRRLSQRIASEVGGRSRVVLNDLGCSLLTRKVIQKNRSQLGFFARAAGQNGFAEKVALTIREFKQQGLDASELATAAGVLAAGNEELAARKLADLSLLYAALERELSGYYLDNDDFMNLFIKHIPDSRWLSQASIWIDGFEGFSVQNMRIILALAPVCGELNVAFTIDPIDNERDRELFWLSRHCLEFMEKALASAGLTCRREAASCPGIATSDAGASPLGETRVRQPALMHLERELFSYPGRVLAGAAPGLEIFSAANPVMEVEYAAARITELVMEQGCRYRDIAVICGDYNLYAPIIQRYFAEYEIPAFMDSKRPVSTHPLAVFLNSALAALDRGFAYEDMALYIKSGLAGLEPGEAELLENYILAHGISGRRWKDEFTYGTTWELPEINGLRERVIDPLLRLQDGIGGRHATCAGISAVLYHFMASLGVQQKLENMAAGKQEQGQTELAYLIVQGWNQVMELLDQLYSVLGPEPVSLKDYRVMLAGGMASIELGLIPTTVDQVMVGDAARSLAREVRALLVLGVNDGVLPSAFKPVSLLNDNDLEAMCRTGVTFSHERQRPQAQERLLLYSLLSKPSQWLCLSFSRADLSGKSARPSLLVERLQRIFPGLQASDDINDPEHLVHNFLKRPRPALRHLCAYLRHQADGKNVEPFWPALAEILTGPGATLTGNIELPPLELVARALAPVAAERPIGQELASRLYGEAENTSISRLERQAACPLAYFAEYGLQVKSRPIFSLQNTDLGSILHEGLAALGASLRSQGLNWHELRAGEAAENIADLHYRIIEREYGELVKNQARSRIMSERLLCLSKRTVDTVAWQIQQGEFVPWQEELRFGAGSLLEALPIRLATGKTAALRGSIDRVDLGPAGDAGAYVRIIDYKTSSRKPEYGLILAGISLQLPAYMLALTQARPDLIPAGIFYLALNDALVRGPGTAAALRQAATDESLQSRLKMQGLVLAETAVIKAMDRDINGYSRVISARISTKDGNPAQSESHLDRNQFEALLEYTRGLLASLYEGSLNGQVQAEPYRYGSQCACDYCPYPALCRFDRGQSGNTYRRLPRLTKEQFFNQVGRQPENLQQ